MAQASSTWTELLEIARWTPSPHNTQPWKLRPIDDRTADLYIVRARTLPDEDTTGSFIRLAMGMFIESLSIIASHRGCRLRDEPREGPEHAGLIPFARLHLEPAGAPPDPLTPRDILDRRTSRLPPAPEPVSDADLAPAAEAAARGGQSLTWSADAALIRAIIQANIEALFHDLNDPKYHDEIALWFRYGRSHSRRRRDGLDSSCMNTPAHELFLTAKYPWLLTVPVLRRFMRALYSRRLGPVYQLGFLAGPFFEPEAAAVPAGRTLLRLWLSLHQRGITIHPFGNMVTNAAAHRRLTELVGRERIWLVFRLGRTATPPRSLRLDTETLLCSDP